MEVPTDMDDLYSINAAAAKLGGVSPGTIRLWLSQGKLKRTKIGRRTMISETELQRFRNAGEGGVSVCRTPVKETPQVG